MDGVGRVDALHRGIGHQAGKGGGHALAVGLVASHAMLVIQRLAALHRSGVGLGARYLRAGLGGQRFEINAHGEQILMVEVLGAVVDDLGHAARHGVILSATRLQQQREVLRAEGFLQTGAAQIAGIPVLHRTAGEVEPAARPVGAQRFFLEEQPARRMAGAAMPQPFDQIRAAVPLRALLGIGFEHRVAHEQPVPDRQRPADGHRPHHIGFAVGRGVWRHALHEIGIQRVHVLRRDARVRRIRHGRVEVFAARRHTMAHRTVELFEAVVADAVRLVRGDVGGIDRAHGHDHLQTADKGLAARRRMAGHAITRAGQIRATLHLLVGKLGRHRQTALRSQQPGQHDTPPHLLVHTRSFSALR